MELTAGGRKVHAATGGRPFDAGKPTVVFLHGAGCDHTVWQLPARWFAWHGSSVLALDLPGHGRSEGPTLSSVRELAAWVGAVLDAGWTGVMAEGARVYPVASYRGGFAVCALFVLAGAVLTLGLQETRGQNVFHRLAAAAAPRTARGES